MAAIHVSEADAVRDFASLMAHVRAGGEVIIENGSTPVAVLRNPPTPVPTRTLSETIARMKASSEKLGYTPTMDAEFAADMEEIIANRKPRQSGWD